MNQYGIRNKSGGCASIISGVIIRVGLGDAQNSTNRPLEAAPEVGGHQRFDGKRGFVRNHAVVEIPATIDIAKDCLGLEYCMYLQLHSLLEKINSL